MIIIQCGRILAEINILPIDVVHLEHYYFCALQMIPLEIANKVILIKRYIYLTTSYLIFVYELLINMFLSSFVQYTKILYIKTFKKNAKP